MDVLFQTWQIERCGLIVETKLVFKLESWQKIDRSPFMQLLHFLSLLSTSSTTDYDSEPPAEFFTYNSLTATSIHEITYVKAYVCHDLFPALTK